MRPVRHFGQLLASSSRRLAKLDVLASSLTGPVDFRKDYVASFVVIELDNFWSSFVRSYYLSWFLRPRTMNGSTVVVSLPSPKSTNDAIRTASTLLYGGTPKGRTGRIAPAWHERWVLAKLSSACGCSHAPQISTAMGVPATAFDYLHSLRNFYAHRSEETAAKLPRIARAFGLVPPKRASEIVLAIPPGRSEPILIDWIAEVRDTVDLLCS
jgi:hypothetical protein